MTERSAMPASVGVIGMIAAKNHRNGCAKPWAQLRKDLGVEFCSTVSEGNPIVAPPLRRTDCSLVSDGAAALVLRRDAADPMATVLGIGQAAEQLSTTDRDLTEFAGGRLATRRAMDMAGVGLDDLSLAEVHDCFTIAELIAYEMLGLTDPGEGRRAIEEGWVQPDGRLPVNVSGGLKAKGTRRAPPACRSMCWRHCNSRDGPGTCNSRTPGWPSCTTWAGSPSRTTPPCSAPERRHVSRRTPPAGFPQGSRACHCRPQIAIDGFLGGTMLGRLGSGE